MYVSFTACVLSVPGVMAVLVFGSLLRRTPDSANICKSCFQIAWLQMDRCAWVPGSFASDSWASSQTSRTAWSNTSAQQALKRTGFCLGNCQGPNASCISMMAPKASPMASPINNWIASVSSLKNIEMPWSASSSWKHTWPRSWDCSNWLGDGRALKDVKGW